MTIVHVFKIKHLPATLTKPSRTKIISERFKMAIVVQNSDSKFDQCIDAMSRAQVELVERGYNVISGAEGINCSYIISDTFKSF